MVRSAIIGLVIACGCASMGGTRITEPFIANLSDFRHLGIQVTSEITEYEAEARSLATALLKKLRARGRFQTVEDLDLQGTTRADLVLQVLVQDVTRVNDVVPLIFGPRSQMASLTLRIRLQRQSNRSYLGESIVDGQYAGGNEYPSTTGEAVDMAAEQIITYLESGMR